MPRFKVAHLHEQGQDMIIVPLESSFGRRISQDQHAIIADLASPRRVGWTSRHRRSGVGQRRRTDGFHRTSAMASVLSKHQSSVRRNEYQRGTILVGNRPLTGI